MKEKLDRAIGSRLKELRVKAGLSLNELASRSGVSRAMIGRIERAESSATATLLGRLCAGLDVTLSAVVGLSDRPPERLARKANQPVWRDPETGYRRRHASAQNVASGIEIMVIDLPEGKRVSYSPWAGAPTPSNCFCCKDSSRSLSAKSASNSTKATASTSTSCGRWRSKIQAARRQATS
jgi:transcriptional regulator with XRE-family HTH domain